MTRNERALWTTVDGRVVVLNVQRGRYYEINRLGSAIWTLLEEPRSVSDIVDHVVSRFVIDRAQCERDVTTFLGELRASDLIVEQEGSTV